MSAEASRAQLAARTNADYANGGHRTVFVPDLNAVAEVAAQVADDAADATSAASGAAGALASYQQMTGQFGVTQGFGSDPAECSRNAELGSSAFTDTIATTGLFCFIITTSYQVLPQDHGKVFICTTGTVTITMPLVTDCQPGFNIKVKRRGATSVTISRNGVNINGGTTNPTVATDGTALTVTKISDALGWESF